MSGGSGRVGRYEILEKLGEGGMGVVYTARDERLERTVALKKIRSAGGDPRARERFWREAKTAASVNHPNVCAIYEVGEDEGEPFLAMELLEGESLAARIAAGTVPVDESIAIAQGVLAALTALHARGIVHRDLKPSNVFLTPHGVKILDFGLARAFDGEGDATGTQLTIPGALLGTPRYLAPELWGGEQAGPSADQFALGAILFEMLTGRPAFDGATLPEICTAIVAGHPPALTGSPAVTALDQAIHRALEKRPRDRYPSLEEMAAALRLVPEMSGSGVRPGVRAMRRLMVLPFRLLRPDAEIDFLSFSLPDAISASLSAFESIQVRSGLAAARFADGGGDLGKIAAEAQVDVVLSGTLLRAGDQVRLSTQLVEAPAGTLLQSTTVNGSLNDIFFLQDELSREIVASLAVPLTLAGGRGAEKDDSSARREALGGARPAATRQPKPIQKDVPATPRAYEMYLRANQLASYDTGDPAVFEQARALYAACLDEDPRYAPAWARLARIHRVLAKYGDGEPALHLARSREAFAKSFELNPDLSIAHNLYTYFEIEELRDPIGAMRRLLQRAAVHAEDANLYVGLVAACRFGGLLDASVEADRRARRIDPSIRTSVHYTFWLQGDYERALERDDEEMRYIRHYTLPLLGREAEAIASCRELEARGLSGLKKPITASMRAMLEGRREEALGHLNELLGSSFSDPEGLFHSARHLARLGAREQALDTLERVVAGGYACVDAIRRDAWFVPLAGEPRFAAAVETARALHEDAIRAYQAAGGGRILGVPAR